MVEINNILDVEKHLDGISGVVFDLDDTLYSEKDYVRSGYRAVATLFPMVDRMEEKLWEVFLRGGKAIDEVLSMEGLYSMVNREKALHAYRFHIPNISLYPGVREMLVRLKKTRKLGLITDGRPEGQRAKIQALGLDPLLDEIIITDELGGVEYRKPCEKAFLFMENRMKLPAGEMVYVADNPIKDFQAPKLLGMSSIWFKNRDGIYTT